MPSSDEEREGPPGRRSNSARRRTTSRSESTSPPNVHQMQTLNLDLDATQQNLRNASSALIDTLNRLQQIRGALRVLETTTLTRLRNPEASTQQNLTPEEPLSRIGPSHSAIVLSDEDNHVPLDTEVLRDRLDRLGALGAELPGYMRAASNFIRNMTNRTDSGGRDATGPSDGQTDSRPSTNATLSRENPERTPAPLPRLRWPTQDTNTTTTTPPQPRQETGQNTGPVNGPLRRRVASRDEASTLLGRRVASRAAATAERSSVNAPAERPTRVLRVWSDYQGSSGAGSGNPIGSRVIVPPRTPNRVSRRIAQFESIVRRDHRQQADSDGSETEVDDSASRPIVVRRSLGGTRSFRQRRADNGSSPPRLSYILPPISPSTSGDTPSTSNSPRFAEEERQEGVSSRMQGVYGRLDRLSNALSESLRDGRVIPAAPAAAGIDSRNEDGEVHSQPEDIQEDRRLTAAYREAIDEAEGRSYRIRRRLNADGDEQVYQINTDAWWDNDDAFDMLAPSYSTSSSRDSGFSSEREDGVWLRYPTGPPVIPPPPSGSASTFFRLDRFRHQIRAPRYAGEAYRSETDLPRLNTEPQDTGVVGRRRRGWARLNADGDEIPTDEEEEIERVRTEQRVRSNWRNTMSASTARTRLEYLAPTTRSVFSHATDEDEDDPGVRLHLPSSQSRRNSTFNVFSNAKREKDETDAEYEFFGTSEPYYLCPLPVPLEDTGPSDSRPSSPYPTAGKGLKGVEEADFAAR